MSADAAAADLERRRQERWTADAEKAAAAKALRDKQYEKQKLIAAENRRARARAKLAADRREKEAAAAEAARVYGVLQRHESARRAVQAKQVAVERRSERAAAEQRALAVAADTRRAAWVSALGRPRETYTALEYLSVTAGWRSGVRLAAEAQSRRAAAVLASDRFRGANLRRRVLHLAGSPKMPKLRYLRLRDGAVVDGPEAVAGVKIFVANATKSDVGEALVKNLGAVAADYGVPRGADVYAWLKPVCAPDLDEGALVAMRPLFAACSEVFCYIDRRDDRTEAAIHEEDSSPPGGAR